MNKLHDIFLTTHKFKPDVNQLDLLSNLDKYLAIIQNQTKLFSAFKSFKRVSLHTNGMYIWGGVGRGKSLILNLFFEALATKQKKWMHFHKFMIHTHLKLNELRNSTKLKDHLMEYANSLAKDYKVIVLDELQINNIADAMIVGRLFTLLIKNGCHVFFSSNLPPQDLFKNGLQRELFLPFIDVIQSKLEIFNLDNHIDYRIHDLKIDNTYIYPFTPQNSRIINDLKNRLTNDQAFSEKTIEIGPNRILTLYKTYSNVANFTFKELCEIPHSAVDYIALCKHFTLMIVENILPLASDNHNELLRFITLIDCLYENRVKLICFADCAPEQIYSHGKHLFEFERTLSRLQEMQTEEYFSKPL